MSLANANLKLRVIEGICSAGPEGNDDFWQSTATSVWVLDGASPICDEAKPAHTVSAKWFVKEFSEAFARISDDSVERRAGKAAEVVRDAAARHGFETSVPPRLQPIATFAVAALTQDAHVSIGTLGDSYCIVETSDKCVAVYGGCEVLEQRGAATAREIAKIRAAKGVGTSGHHVELIRETLAWIRSGLNEPGGYDLLSLDTRGAYRLRVHAKLLPSEIRQILLCTDGFYRLVNVIGCYRPAALLSAAATKGLSALLKELRDFEGALDLATVKQYDDATAVVLEVWTSNPE